MKPLIVLSILLLSFNTLFSGIYGKISGVIRDADTNESLAGVNVLLGGTSMGTASDAEGYFSLINVPAGKYNITFMYVGYSKLVIKEVQVKADLTSTLNVAMKPEMILGETIEVVDERPLVDPGMSNSQLNVESESIEALPVQSVTEVLSLQAGIEESSNGLTIRGGGANQTVFMLDGLSTNDEREGLPNTSISTSAIDYVQVQTGGFNAEYGQARSGIVNVVTKSGDISKYSGVMTVHYHPAAPKHFGQSVYSKNSYFNRPFYDPEVMWTGTDNGAWDDYTRNQYPSFAGGWNAVADATLKDDDPTNDLTPEAAFRLFNWYRRRDGDIKKPDYRADFGFGGPIPFLGKSLGNPRFYLSYFKNKEMFVFPLSEDGYSESQGQLKITTDVSPNIKLMVAGLMSQVNSSALLDWSGFSRSVVRSTYDVANLPSSSNTGLSIPFMPGYFSPTEINANIFDLKWTHTLTQKSFYEVKLQYKKSKYNTSQVATRDTTRKYEVIPGYFVDEAPYGYWGNSVLAPGGMHLGGWMNLERDKSEVTTTSAFVDYSNQFNRANLFKMGVSLVINRLNIDHYSESPKDTWRRSMIYDVSPFRIAAYAQNKMEFDGFIANIGLRMDYSNANSNAYDLTAYDDFYSAAYGSDIEELAPTKQAKSTLTLSPRLGISHPISEKAKLYFNYGHFRSEPYSSYRFRLQRESNGQVMYMGDPNLDQEKTIAYEAGYEHDIADMYLLKVAGYYKDVTKQPGWVFYRGMNQVNYRKAESNNYADIRGLELTLTKKAGRWFSGFINYTYDVRSSGYFGLLQYNEDPELQKEYLLQNPAQYRTHPRPYARLNLSFYTPDDYGPMVMGMNPLGGWMLNLLGNWKAGSYSTFNPNNLPGISDNVQWVDYSNMDLRLSKTFQLKKYKVKLYFDVANLFNQKRLSYAGFSDYYDWQDYLQSLNFSWEENEEHGNDKLGDYRDWDVPYDPLEHNPNNDPEIKARNDERKKNKSYIDMPNIRSLSFLNPRAITFGLNFSF